MSSYFDMRAQVIAEDADRYDDDASFLSELAGHEREAFQTISLNTGDIEFPHDLRERIMGAFAVHGVMLPTGGYNEKAAKWALETRASRVLEDVHDLFHMVARRRIETRFGFWTDNPHANLARRDEHDAETAIAGWSS